MNIDDFITKWKASGGAERANYVLFLNELCALLELPKPEPTVPDDSENAYVFERSVTFQHGDGSTSKGFIDLYKRGCFVLEAKQGSEAQKTEKLSSAEQHKKLKKGTAKRGTKGWDTAMLRAHGQASQYARSLPVEEGRPPFVVVVDVGHSIELFSDFSRSGASYVPFPDSRSHRIFLDDLHKAEIRQRLKTLWLKPMDLDPARASAKITREIAQRLAKLSVALEQDKHDADSSAHFLMRCLFTMFAEDIGLLPKRSFTELLLSLKDTPEQFAPMVEELWQKMNAGGFSVTIRSKVLRFNGGLFADSQALPLNKDQLQLLIEAAEADWQQVEPAIFGTLLERALDPIERHKLGAHYTPRAYVERLVMPTVIEPLREEWQAAQAAAYSLDQDGKHDEAIKTIQAFHSRLTHLRVLDPACGSGNFLYVTLEHLKRLEGEVLGVLEDMGETQGLFAMQGTSVDPHQLMGLEVNPRAAAIADVVLWIGYLQWHARTHGDVQPAEPVLKDFHNIQCRDALLEWERVEPMLNDEGQPVTRWDGRTTKTHPVTGEQVPDENARVEVMRYIGAKKAQWPEADFIVGNPPFVGEKKMRDAFGDAYTETLRHTYKELPACDFVMYWWHKAGELLNKNKVNRFGFITTNSLTQTKNRKIVEQHLAKGLNIKFAIPDHPWVDSSDGAAVRIAMTVCAGDDSFGELKKVLEEHEIDGDARDIKFTRSSGQIHANLQMGTNAGQSESLIANKGLVFQGVKISGSGFIIDEEQKDEWISKAPACAKFLPLLIAGTDLSKARDARFCIDFFGLSINETKIAFPEGFQHVLLNVKPVRDQNKRATYRDNWWIFAEPRRNMRSALTNISKYIATSEVSKHRFFIFLETKGTLADGSLAVIASDKPMYLGILSSRLHVFWALLKGGRMGVGNDARWQNGPCFETFPFPDATANQKTNIAKLAEQLDAHRKKQQAQHPKLTLTGLYNVLEKLRRGEPLSAKEKNIHEQGLVSVLKEIHDDLDRAVFAAYGWQDLGDILVGRPGATTPLPDKPAEQAEAEEELLKRLVALNHERAAEERRGLVRWLRPEFQNPEGKGGEQISAEVEQQQEKTKTQSKLAWPKDLPGQMQALRKQLETSEQGIEAKALARRFKNAKSKRVEELLQTLVALGQAREISGGFGVG